MTMINQLMNWSSSPTFLVLERNWVVYACIYFNTTIQLWFTSRLYNWNPLAWPLLNLFHYLIFQNIFLHFQMSLVFLQKDMSGKSFYLPLIGCYKTFLESLNGSKPFHFVVFLNKQCHKFWKKEFRKKLVDARNNLIEKKQNKISHSSRPSSHN